MFDTLAGQVPRDRDFPERTWWLDVLKRVREGTLYDVLSRDFHVENEDNGEYIPLHKRKPSVRYNLCNMVVTDSVGLLFGEGHFPEIDCLDDNARQAMADVIKDSRLPEVMEEAAIKGSVGSVAVLMRVLKNRVFFTAMETGYLTPTWRDDVPDMLLNVVERYKLSGQQLRDAGYAIPDRALAEMWWFQRVWDDTWETRYLPWPVAEDRHVPLVDAVRSTLHGLGFVPIAWIRNLPGGNCLDGVSDFRPAIETSIQIDYLLSQGSRGLKYSSDPLLLLKEPASSDGSVVRSSSNAIVVSAEGDAKMLEIGGTASDAMLAYVRALREMALESIRGNRSNADKLSAAQSGRALELLHQPLIWLADCKRRSYGEHGLLPLLRMVMAASRKYGLETIDGDKIRPFPAKTKISLRWPQWFVPTGHDQAQDAQAKTMLFQAGLISRETAVKIGAKTNDVENVPQELTKIAADIAEEDARLAKQAAQTQAKTTVAA